MTRLMRAAMAGVLGLAVCGCGGDENPLGRVPLSGTVTFQGEPLPNGMVNFQPEPGNTPALGTGGVIKEGEFSIPEEDGLPPGRYRVFISSAEAEVEEDVTITEAEQGNDNEDLGPGESPPAQEDLIPASWNSESQQYIDIPAGGDAQEFTFDVK